MSKASRKLFDSSDDEESDSKEDSTRFSIKPQFEGRAGQRLVKTEGRGSCSASSVWKVVLKSTEDRAGLGWGVYCGSRFSLTPYWFIGYAVMQMII